MARAWDENSPKLWVRALQDLPPEPHKFVLAASSNTLPTNANLHTWGKEAISVVSARNTARLCHMSLTIALLQWTCDATARDMMRSMRSYLPPNFSITIDLPSNSYSFPHHITPTNLRPDIVWWSEQLSELWLFELIVSYETVVADARERKHSKYHNLMEAGRAAGFRCELISLEVGSRGILSFADLEPIQDALEIPRKDLTNLALMAIRTTILE